MESMILENLGKSVKEYDKEGAARWATAAMEDKIDPLEALDVLTEAIREIGDAFGAGECFLPELVSAAEAMQEAMETISGFEPMKLGVGYTWTPSNHQGLPGIRWYQWTDEGMLIPVSDWDIFESLPQEQRDDSWWLKD